MIVAAAVLVVLSVPLLISAVSSPHLVRLGLRNAIRRPGEAMVVTLGSTIASALIVAAMLIGHSFGESITTLAVDSLGPIDETIDVTGADPAAGAAEVAAAVAATTTGTESERLPIDGVLAIATTETTVATVGALGSDGTLTAPAEAIDAENRSGNDGSSTSSGTNPGVRALTGVRLVAADVTDLATFGGEPAHTGFGELVDPATLPDGPALAVDAAVVVNRDIADRLGVDRGDEIVLAAGGSPHTVVVNAVVAAESLAGRFEVVVTPDTMAELSPTGVGVDHSVLVSNEGDVLGGEAVTSQVLDGLRLAVADVEAMTDIEPVKRELLELADVESAETTSLFATIGGFSVAAGVLLIVNLFVMLAAERRRELGTLRALGLGRSAVVRTFLAEGLTYGIVAAVVGAGLGVGIAAVVIAMASGLWSDEVTLSLVLSSDRVLVGALIGLVVTQLTVTATSLRISRIDIVSALKDEAAVGSGSRRTVIAASFAGIALGIGLTVVGAEVPAVVMAGPVIALLSAVPLLSPLVGRTSAVLALAGPAAIWPVAVFSALPSVMEDLEVEVFLVQGLLLVGTTTMLAGAVSPLLARRLGGRSLAGRLGLAHPADRPGRTGLLVSMYALVIFTVTFMAMMTAVFRASVDDQARLAVGDWDIWVEASPSSGLTTDTLNAQPGVAGATARLGGEVMLQSGEIGRPSEAVGIDSAVLDVATPDLEAWDPRFTDTAEVWAAVADRAARVSADDGTRLNGDAGAEGADDAGAADADRLNAGHLSGDRPTWIIVPSWSEFAVGEVIEISAVGGEATIEATVAGRQIDGVFANDEIHIAAERLVELGAADGPASRFLVATTEGVEPADVAAGLSGSLLAAGVSAEPLDALADEAADSETGFINVLQAYLSLGLLIGIAGLGVVLSRAVRERRGQIGMLGAIGFEGRTLARAFLVEGGFVGAQGVAIGIILGVVSAWQTMTRTETFGAALQMRVPVAWLAGFAVATLAAAVIAAVAPAVRAARTSPAVALRHRT